MADRGIEHVVAVLLVAAGVMAGVQADNTNSPASGGGFLVHPDGSVAVSGALVESVLDGQRAGKLIRFEFGLPHQPPLERSLEGDGIPICHTRWESGGIRYIETVLLTRLKEGDLDSDGKAAPDAVLIVRISGECLASEYTEATASFAILLDDRPIELDLRAGLVRPVVSTNPVVVAAIDIPAGGVSDARGSVLRFRGSMPPGTSGCMIVKIPLAQLKSEKAITWLSDLEFDIEFRRVKRFWQERSRTGIPTQLPVVLASGR